MTLLIILTYILGCILTLGVLNHFSRVNCNLTFFEPILSGIVMIIISLTSFLGLFVTVMVLILHNCKIGISFNFKKLE